MDNSNPSKTEKSNILSWIAIGLAVIAIIAREQPTQPKDYDARISKLENAQDAQGKIVTKILSDIADLQIQGWKFVALNTSTKDYSTLQSDLGKFLISVQNVQKYANGYKLTLNIGNPNAVTYNNVVANFNYGSPFDKKQDFQSWVSSLKSAQAHIDKPLLPGTWNRVTLVVAPAKEDDLGFITMGLETSQVMLTPDYRAQEE